MKYLPQLSLVAALALIIAGIALIYPPAAFIASGLAILAAVTFDPNRAGRLTWPR
ncbi:MAG: hypothetical protein IT341_10645 [Chloroflexi bacterium]|nr:hypothetical protein [Chloroflexota bacterium]